MPLEVCRFSRSSRSTICKESAYSAPDRGYCVSQAMSYYGYKLHAVCSAEEVFKSIDIIAASIHDIHYLKDIKEQLADCILLGDKGCLSADIQVNLFETRQIKLEVPMRKNQHNFKEQLFVFRKTRKPIETLFSKLFDHFRIRRNYVKSFDGFKTRIISKITTVTIIQFINRFTFNRNINNLKIQIT